MEGPQLGYFTVYLRFDYIYVTIVTHIVYGKVISRTTKKHWNNPNTHTCTERHTHKHTWQPGLESCIGEPPLAPAGDDWLDLP